MPLFTGVTTRWWHARTLAELALSLDQIGAAGEASEHRRQALALREELGTSQVQTLAGELERQRA